VQSANFDEKYKKVAKNKNFGISTNLKINCLVKISRIIGSKFECFAKKILELPKPLFFFYCFNQNLYF